MGPGNTKNRTDTILPGLRFLGYSKKMVEMLPLGIRVIDAH